MGSLRGWMALTAGILALGPVASADAGWQSVYQVTCFHSTPPSATSSYFWDSGAVSSSNFADPCNPCPQPCPQPVVTTRYVQRCCYEPVTTYRMQTYQQAVTTYQTSFFWEPCTSYRYTCQFDPCTCSYRKVATPVTSYSLKQRCCPVTSYVQRCCYVPVTTMRQSCYWEPQTCYSLVDPCTGKVVDGNGRGGAAVRESTNGAAVQEQRGPAAVPNSDGNYNTPRLPEPSGSRSSYQRPAGPPQYVNPPATEPVKPITPQYDRITLDNQPKNGAILTGHVVSEAGRQLPAGTRLLFVSETAAATRAETTTDQTGQFRVDLSTGEWRVYVRDDAGRPVYQTQVNVKEREPRQLTLVSRTR